MAKLIDSFETFCRELITDKSQTDLEAI